MIAAISQASVLTKEKPNWAPQISRVTVTSNTDDGVDILAEQVWFVPNESIRCVPGPIEKGISTHSRVTYRRGCRPENKEDWERALGVKIQTML